MGKSFFHELYIYYYKIIFTSDRDRNIFAYIGYPVNYCFSHRINNILRLTFYQSSEKEEKKIIEVSTTILVKRRLKKAESLRVDRIWLCWTWGNLFSLTLSTPAKDVHSSKSRCLLLLGRARYAPMRFKIRCGERSPWYNLSHISGKDTSNQQMFIDSMFTAAPRSWRYLE